MYLTITNQDTLETLALNVVHREREVHQYQINIDNYSIMLDALPKGDIPPEIEPYMNTAVEDIPNFVSLDTVKLISDYQQRKRITGLIRTETVEQSKSKSILEALKAQIPADQLDALVADALAKINAQTPAA